MKLRNHGATKVKSRRAWWHSPTTWDCHCTCLFRNHNAPNYERMNEANK